MSASLQSLPQHVTRSIQAPLQVMEELGHSKAQCLAGTGISDEQLLDPESRMSLQQELAFYRNVLALSGDVTIGLQLGLPFTPQRYGLFGYALLSAATFRHSLRIVEHFGKLTFSFYTFSFGVSGGRAWFSMSRPPPIEQALVDLYTDRDMSAAVVGYTETLGERFEAIEVHLTHDGHGRRDRYREHFGVDVRFGMPDNRFVFDASILDRPLPQADPESSRQIQQQCQMMIARLTRQGGLVNDVRMIILARPGFFPDIDYVAERIGMSTRTLRRRLREEGSSYRALLDEIRFGLARDYLGQTRMPMEQIAELLGYTETGNFSHAFRRWSGQSPSSWRGEHPPGAI